MRAIVFPVFYILVCASVLPACSSALTADYSSEVQSLVLQAYSSAPEAALPLQEAHTFYSTHATSIDQVNAAMSISRQQLTTSFQSVDTGMCTTATVMAFLAEISRLQTAGKIRLTAEALQELKLKGDDGVGFWGRWNADGPGTALLFQDYNLGRNFQDIKNAKPGDFMKIFWNDRMGETPGAGNGTNEKGHSVIFAGTAKIKNVWYVQFWSDNSANTPGFPDAIGFKMKYKKLSDIKHNIFSRLEHPENLNRLTLTGQPKTNAFLASLLSTSYSYADGIQASGLRFSDPDTLP